MDQETNNGAGNEAGEVRETDRQADTRVATSIDDIIEEGIAKQGAANEKRESEEPEKAQEEEKKNEKEDKPKEDSNKEKGGKKQTFKDRISEVITQRNQERERAAALENTVQGLQKELETLKQGLSSAVPDADDADGGVELPEELSDLADPLNAFIEKSVRARTAAIEEKLAAIEKANKDTEQVKYQANVNKMFHDVAAEFSDLFEDGKLDVNGFPLLKAEFEKEAMELVEKFSIPSDDKGGVHNPLIDRPEGLRILFGHLSRNIKEAQEASMEIEKTKQNVDKAKKGRVEAPRPNVQTKHKPQTLDDIINDAVKQFGG